MPNVSAAPAAVPHMELVDPTFLVYRIDIFLLTILLVFATFNAPRAIARFAHRSEWFQGHLLHSVKLTRKPRINLNTRSIYLSSNPQSTALDLDDVRTDTMHFQSTPYPLSQSTHFDKELPPRPFYPRSFSVVTPVSMQQTWHMPMLSSLANPVSSLLHKRVHENYSLGQVILMAGYIVVVLYAGLYESSPFVDFLRSGWISVSQLPFIYVLATKNNVIGMLVGVGYEKLNYLHRLAGLLAVIAANVHAIGFFYEWSIAGTLLKHLSYPSNKWGLVALVCMDLLGVFSMPTMRSKFYNLFFTTHAAGLLVLLFSLCYHHDEYIPYVALACGFYGLDHLVRAIKTRIATATIRPIPELGLTRMEIPSLNAGWRAGQHVRLRVLSTVMGIWGMTEVHPFTVASVSKTEEGLVLLCKKTGRWTTRMYNMAGTSVYGEQGQEVGRKIRVMIEGPYGGVGNTVIPSYSGAMFVVGGSGVTFALSTVQDLVRSAESSNLMEIDVVWCIADPSSLTPMIPLFGALVSQSSTARLHISIFYTRAPTRPFDGIYLPPGITLRAGRPNLARQLENVIQATLSTGGCSGVFVGVCGPVSLAESVSDTVRCFDPQVKRAVGGVEVHEEVFGW